MQPRTYGSKATGVVSHASESRMSLGSGYSGPAGESEADQAFELITGPPFTSDPIPIKVTLNPSLFF